VYLNQKRSLPTPATTRGCPFVDLATAVSARTSPVIVLAVPVTSGFNHVATLTSDMDLTVRFYEQAFDAVVTFEVAKRDDHPWMKILDLGGGAALNVFEVPAEEIIGERRRQGGRGAIDHFALAVSSPAVLQQLVTRLEDAGAQEVGQPQRLGDEWSLFFRDPDGMELEVCCPADAS
jgi:catechol 2,3-dioxygenase-like lactoylglutathione lyase family enzyme